MNIDSIIENAKPSFVVSTEFLDKISDDIRKLEKFLNEYNPGIGHELKYGTDFLCWGKPYGKGNTRLFGMTPNEDFQGGYEQKPLLEWNVHKRMKFYEMIPTFMRSFTEKLTQRNDNEHAK